MGRRQCHTHPYWHVLRVGVELWVKDSVTLTLTGTYSVSVWSCESKQNMSIVMWESVKTRYLSTSSMALSRRAHGVRYTITLLPKLLCLVICLEEQRSNRCCIFINDTYTTQGVHKKNKNILHRRRMASIVYVSWFLVSCPLSRLVVSTILWPRNEKNTGMKNDTMLRMTKGNTSAGHIVRAYN